MKTIEKICAHSIEFNYHSNSKHATPSDSELEYVQTMLIDNYREGELNMIKVINRKEKQFTGWWKIIS